MTLRDKAARRARRLLGPRSLALRLVLGAAIWIGLGLLVGGLVLSALFRDYVERSFDARLLVLLESLIAVSEIDAEGGLVLTRAVGEPRFERIYSGWYWQISVDGVPRLQSRSLWDQSLPAAGRLAAGEIARAQVVGPEGESLRLIERDILLPGAPEPYRYAVAAERREAEADIAVFDRTLAWSLGLLGAGLLLAVFLQVRFGLEPLRRLQSALVAVRAGRAARLEGAFPAEIEPLARELNTLLAHNAAVVERARTHVSNLAHALKTPLSVLTNDAAAARGPLADSVRRQTAVMRRQVDHYLARARTAAAGGVLGARTELAPVIEDLRRTLARIHAGRGLAIAVTQEPGLAFRGERQDLEEMLGNLIDNACKWARARVAVSARLAGDRLLVAVEDDGPGLPEAERDAVFKRGRRLDESVPGSGLGLAIVRDIAGLYDGRIELDRSPLGGLAARLTLPAAEAPEAGSRR